MFWFRGQRKVKEIVDFLKVLLNTKLGGKIQKVLKKLVYQEQETLLQSSGGEAKVLFSLSGSDFVEMFVVSHHIRDLFKQAKEKSPSNFY